MSEQSPKYNAAAPVTLAALAGRPCALVYSAPGYQPPTPDEVAGLIKIMDWSQGDVAKLTGVNYDPKKGSSTVRRWKTSADNKAYRPIPYAAWRLLLLYAGAATMDAAEYLKAAEA